MRVAVTGAFGYSGRYIAHRLLDAGHQVITLTNSPNRPNPFGNKVEAFRFNFGAPRKLAESLEGCEVLVNTYWVRFDHARFSHDEAVSNTRVLFHSAAEAGVRRIVHVSITNPDSESDLPYFRGKAELESALQESGLSFCILRPTVLFGKEDVLINNIAWSLRRFPVFGVFGKGDYRLQPIHVDDLAKAAVEKAQDSENEIIQAIGPETFTYRSLVEQVRNILGLRTRIVSVSPGVGYWAGRLIGAWTKDVVITREEITGLMENRLWVDAPPLGETRLTDWIARHRDTLGRKYTSEMKRRLDRFSPYRSN